MTEMIAMVRHASLIRPLCLLLMAVFALGACGSEDDDGPGQIADDPPVVEITDGPEEVTHQRSAEFSFQCDRDEGCDFECSLDDADATPCESPHSYDNLDDGDHVFSVVAVDGDLTSEPASWEWTVDTSQPVIVVHRAPPPETMEETATFEFECDADPDCVFDCALDYDADGDGQFEESAWESCTSPHVEEGLEPGAYEFHIRATNELGNQAQTTQTWNVLPRSGWEEVSMGGVHTCAVHTEGTLWCWGTNDFGQLGTEDTDGHDEPVRVGEDDDWISVSANGGHSCGIRDDGSLWCWGSNSHRQLGIGDVSSFDEPSHGEPLRVGESTDWTSVAAGIFHTCATRDDGTLWCWGFAISGRLGLGTDIGQVVTEPAQVEGNDWETVDANASSTCAIREDGTLWCWGSGDAGQLGLGDTDNRTEPAKVGEEDDWESISISSYRSCGVRGDGTLWCWGDPAYLPTPQWESVEPTLPKTPQRIGEDDDWLSVSTSVNHSCAIKKNYSLWCWAREGSLGVLGHGEPTVSSEPRVVAQGDHWRSVATDQHQSCAIQQDGTLWCWGQRGRRSLGLGHEKGDSHSPTETTIDSSIAQLSAGTQHGCALMEDGQLWCWGANDAGQMGVEEVYGSQIPMPVGYDTDWRFLSAGVRDTCAIRDDDTLWCWGAGDDGRLGLGDEDERRVPSQVGDATDWEMVDSGAAHTCGIRDEGTLWCWGKNDSGQLGLGDETNRTEPRQVGESSDWNTVSAGVGIGTQEHTCAIRDDDTLWCWGGGITGVDFDGPPRDEPAQVGDDADWRSVTAGVHHTCGIRTDDTLWCWGQNIDGILGIGESETVVQMPSRVGEDADWKSVSAAGHTCGVRNDGTLWCWGPNFYGQLGLGDQEARDVPHQVGEDSDWTGVSMGATHTHGLRDDGSGWSWGANLFGQLGDGLAWVETPQRISDPTDD